METQNLNNNSSELKTFFTDHLKTLYWAEKKLVDTLPDMEDAASTGELKEAFRDHLNQTRQHVTRLEQVFNSIGEEADTEKCKIMKSITDAGAKTISNTDDGSAVRDAGLIFGGQLAEHYEIACYGNMIALAKVLGYNEAVSIFEKTLAEEKEADALLTQIGEQNVNYKAASEVEA